MWSQDPTWVKMMWSHRISAWVKMMWYTKEVSNALLTWHTKDATSDSPTILVITWTIHSTKITHSWAWQMRTQDIVCNSRSNWNGTTDSFQNYTLMCKMICMAWRRNTPTELIIQCYEWECVMVCETVRFKMVYMRWEKSISMRHSVFQNFPQSYLWIRSNVHLVNHDHLSSF